MKRIFILGILVLYPSFAVFADVYDGMALDLLKKVKDKKQQRIAVLPFDYRRNPSQGKAISEALLSALIQKGATVVDRSKLNKIMKEQSLHQTGITSEKSAIEVGNIIGVAFMLTGSVSNYRKTGLLVQAKLISIKETRVVATAKTKVNKNDIHSKYRRVIPKGPVRYPGFLELFVGISSLNYFASYTDPTTDAEIEFDSSMDTGTPLAIRYSKRTKGFFCYSIEFMYNKHKPEKLGWDKPISIYNINVPLLIRIPLWRYIDALADYTYFYLGFSFGGILTTTTYMLNNKSESAIGYGFSTAVLGGIKIGLTESVSLNGEYRYLNPAINNYFYSRKMNGEDVLVTNKLGGRQILLGISFAP